MPPALQAFYSDYVADATGHAVAGATVALYPVRGFAPGVLPTAVPAQPPVATAPTDAAGRFTLTALPPDDYHVLVRYMPVASGGAAAGEEQMTWRYHVAVAPHEGAERTARHALGTMVSRTLAKLLGGLPVTILCLGDGVTAGYNATGVVSGGWVAGLTARLAAAFPAARVVRYDPVDYAITLDAPIPGWTATALQPGIGSAAQQIAVINAGVTGDTAMAAVRRVTNLTAASWSPPPDCYVVLLGAGEMGLDATSAATPADFAGHLAGLVAVLRAGGAEAVLCTPHAGPAAADPDAYARAVRGVAAATGCGLVDLRQLWQDHYDPAAPNDGQGAWLNTLAGDHVHPTDAGHGAIGAEVFKTFDAASALPVNGVLGGGATWEQARLLNTSSLLQLTGAWSAHTGFALAGLLASPREMQTATPGDRLTFTARCSEIYMLCRRWHDGGQIAVTVDGANLGTVDLYRASPASTVDLADPNGAIAPRDRVPLALGLADTVHSVTLQLAATANGASQGTVWRFDAIDLLRLRQGGLAVEGTEPLQRVQRGAVAVALSGAATGSAAITFPLPYAGPPPVVIAQSPHPSYYAVVGAVSATGATITLAQYAHTSVTDTQVVSWIALG